jgi:thiol-disulfide isomerase/thioredoxin
MKYFISLLIFFHVLSCHGQKNEQGYQISVKWIGLKDTTIYLAHYFDTQVFVDDTIQLNQKGEGIFNKKKELKQGLYMIYLNEKQYFDFLLGSDQTLMIQTSNPELRENLKIDGAPESEKFLAYQNFLFRLNQTRSKLNENLKTANGAEKEKLITELKEIDNEMARFIEAENSSLPGSMYHVFIKAVAPPTAPTITAPANHPRYDSITWHQQYHHRTLHFLEGFNFADSRILYTPLLKSKLDAYFNQVLLQIPDTIIKHGLRIIDQARPDKQMFQYTSQYLLNWGLQSKIMGMDAVFVAVADHVYLKGMATWADSTTLAKINEEAFFLRNNLVGKKAAPLNILDIDDKPFSLYELNAPYTIIVFWEPECGHCKKEIPLLYEKVYMKFIDKNIEVVAVYTGAEKKEWTDFVEEKELVGWHHVYDLAHISKYRYHYNVRTTPQIYLLDHDKKIIAKRLDPENIEKLIEALLNEK